MSQSKRNPRPSKTDPGRHPDTLPDVRPVGVSARYQRREDLREFGSAVREFLKRRDQGEREGCGED